MRRLLIQSDCGENSVVKLVSGTLLRRVLKLVGFGGRLIPIPLHPSLFLTSATTSLLPPPAYEQVNRGCTQIVPARTGNVTAILQCGFLSSAPGS